VEETRVAALAAITGEENAPAGKNKSRILTERNVATRAIYYREIDERCFDAPLAAESYDSGFIVITADRGSLKAYQVSETPTRGPESKINQAFDITDAHGRLLDKVDRSGRTFSRYRARRSARVRPRSPKVNSERNRPRINKELADQITKVINGRGRKGLGLRRAVRIHSAIVDLLPDAFVIELSST